MKIWRHPFFLGAILFFFASLELQLIKSSELLPSSLKIYASAGAGYDWVDTKALAARGMKMRSLHTHSRHG
jgi:lactate dehydrogenase-like 2-hydroxyacid dehydrogenase